MTGGDFMMDLDRKTLETLGFYTILDSMCISTAFGNNLLYTLKQITDEKALKNEYENIEKCLIRIKDDKFFNNFKDLLARFKDIRNTFLSCKNGEILDEVQLFEIKRFTLSALDLKNFYEESKLELIGINLLSFKEVYQKLNPIKNETSSFYIYDEYSTKLSEIRLKKSNLDKIVFKNNLEESLLKERASLANEEKNEEFLIRKKLSSELTKYMKDLLTFTENIGKLDLLLAKSKLALDYNMCHPHFHKDKFIKMENGIHPIIKDKIASRGGIFYPISIEVNCGTTVITGANMSGKTVILNIIALNYIMATLGFFSFAKDFQFTPLSFICFLREDATSLENGLSSFGGEIIHLKYILNKLPNEAGLILIDEFARGTNPLEGSNLSKALILYLNRFSSISILSTHYDGVCTLAKQHYQIKGLKSVDFKTLKNSLNLEEDKLKLINSLMDYTLEKVEKTALIPKDALNICSLLGVNSEFIKIAEEIYTGRSINEK